MTPRMLTPNDDMNGQYSHLVARGKEGVEIAGVYSTLNLAGARIPNGRLIALTGSGVEKMLLAGASVPHGVNLERMTGKRLYGQGLSTRALDMGDFSDYIDLSFARVDGTLDLTYLGYTPLLMNLRDSWIDVLDFGHDANRKFGELDMRGARIGAVKGYFPAEYRAIRINEETAVPEDWQERLDSYEAYLDSLKR